jgi:hypothetical protein
MNLKTAEMVAKDVSKRWYLSITAAAAVMGVSRQRAARFLTEHAVPYRVIGKAKVYFLPEILDAVDSTKWER